MAKCPQTNIPQVDNDAPECLEFINPKCIIIPESNPFIGAQANTPLDDYLDLMTTKMTQQQYLINVLVNQINNLTETVNNLNP